MDNQPCTVGFAQLDTTPPLGTYIGGYYETRITKGVLDPTYVRAVAFTQGEKTAVLLVLDSLGNYGVTGFQWPGQIAQELGLPKEAIIVCHTHSHTTGLIDSYREPKDEQYTAWLYRRLCDAARMALDDRKEVTDVRLAQGQTEGMTFVRRYVMQDGTVKTNPSNTTPESRAKIVRPACDTDESLRLVRILRAEGPELVFVSYQVHPDSLGGEKISADFPGALCRRVEERMPNTRCVFLNGCEGQMVRGDRRNPPPDKTLSRYERCMIYGAKLADEALGLWDKTQSTGRKEISFAQVTVRAKAKRDPAFTPIARKMIELFQTGRQGEIKNVKGAERSTVPEAFYFVRHEDLDIDYIDLPLTGIAVGGVALVGIPGEPFNEIGKHLRENTEFAAVCVCCQANGSFGYYPLAKAYDEGGYEPHNTRVVKGTAEQIMAGCDELLAKL